MSGSQPGMDLPPHPHRRRRHRRASDAGARHRRCAPRACARCGAGADRRRARRRGPPAPDPRFPLPPPARPSRSTAAPGGRTSAGPSSPATCCARSGGCSPKSVPSRSWAPGGMPRSGRLVGDAARDSDRRPGTERVSRARDPAPEPPGPARLPGPAGGAVAAPLRPGRPAYSIPATRSPLRLPRGARRRWPRSGSAAPGRSSSLRGEARARLHQSCRGRLARRRLDRLGVRLIWVTGRGTHAEFARTIVHPTYRSSISWTPWPTDTLSPIWSSRGRG